MRRLSVLTICVASLCIATAGSAHATAYHTGPHWWYKTKELTRTTETLLTKFKAGATRWKSSLGTIECASATGTGQIEGGSPGTGSTTIKFAGCKTVGGLFACEVRNKGGTMGTVEVKTGVELVYLTKAAIEQELAPLGLVFKTVGEGEKKLVELEFSGVCSFVNGALEATGEERTAGTPGLAGMVCKIVEKIETPAVMHEIECLEAQQTSFWYWKAGTAAEGKAGLTFKGEKTEVVIAKGEVELESKESYAASGSSFPGWFTKGVEIGAPTAQAVLRSGLTVVTVPGIPLPITLRCEKDVGFITLEPIGWATKGDITLENCKVVQDATCNVSNILIQFANQLVFVVGTKKADVGGLFEMENSPIEVSGCTREGRYLLRGTVAGESTPLETESKAVDQVFHVTGGAQDIAEVEDAFHDMTLKPKLELYSEAEKVAYAATFEGTEEEELESKEQIELRR